VFQAKPQTSPRVTLRRVGLGCRRHYGLRGIDALAMFLKPIAPTLIIEPDTFMVTKIPYDRRILILGCGSVSQCTLPLLLRHVEMPPARITVLDMADRRDAIADALLGGIRYVIERITRQKYAEQFARYVGPGDIIIDLAWNLGTTDLLGWCHRHDVSYLNTSMELWDPYADRPYTTDGTLYGRQMNLRRMIAGWPNNNGPTALIEHGANAGLVSHFARMGLLDIAHKILNEEPPSPRLVAIEKAIDERAYNKLAQLVGLKVIHISERDTQICESRAKEVDEFVNTWSVEGCYEEATAPAEMGWGTHEHSLPAGALLHQFGPRNQIYLTSRGMNTWVHSWVPSGEIVGMVIRHGEAFSISEALTLNGDNGTPEYRPTVHYAYCPCDAATASLHELRMRDYKAHERRRIMRDDIVSGRDEMGCLLMGHDYKVWWVGSLLDIEETRRLVPGQNATTLQVAAGVLGALYWIIRNPRAGVRLPDHLPHEEIMEVALPYLGPFVSKPVDWLPPALREKPAAQSELYPTTDAEPWQFKHFQVLEPQD
jgi:homospermidine synthase